MIKILKKTIKWIGIAVAVMIVIILLCLGVQTTPGPFMLEDKKYRAITVHTETPIGPETDSIMAEIFTRLEAVPIYDPDRKMNLILCSTQDKFSFFSRFTLRDKRVMGYCLLGNGYVNVDFIKELAGRTGGRPKYNTREGSVIHVTTHELMHQYLGDAHGEFASRFLPTWKTEGYCEYGVNHFVAPRDSGYTIPERIDIYLDDSQWNPTARTHRPHYIWGLMMEYLINVRGISFGQVMADSVIKDRVYQEMMAWRESLDGQNQQSAILDQALVLYNENKLSEALPLLIKAASQHQDNAEAHAWLAETYRRLGMKDEALESAYESLRHDSCNAFAHTVIADAYRQPHSALRSDPDSNWVHLRAAVQCDGRDGNAWMSLWNEAVLRAKHGMARQALSKLTEIGFLTPAVLTYGRWMLQTLPDSAILITNGDMDTYPPLALQVVERLRPDVIVIERGLLNTAQYLRYVRDHYNVPLPISADRFDSLMEAVGTNRNGPSVSDLMFQGLIARKLSDSLARPIAISVTVDKEYYSQFASHFQYAGPFLLWQRTPPAVSDTAAIRASISGIRPDDFTGSWVSDRDRSPVRRLYTRYLASNVTKAALVFSEVLIKSDNTEEALHMLRWAEAFEGNTELGSVFADEIAQLRTMALEKID